MMAWGIIIVAVLVVYGAVMWVRPSERDKHLANLRMLALKQGIKVQQVQMRDMSVEGRVNNWRQQKICYRKLNDYAARTTTTVLRTSGESGIHLPDGWTYEHDERLPRQIIDMLTSFLEELPETITAVEFSPGYVGISWDEKDVDQLDQIKKDLDFLSKLIWPAE